MTQLSEALALVGISADSSNEERKIAFESKRDKLEAQTVQSPTPALKEKFRAKLRELEQANQLIEQELTSDELPVVASADLDSNQNQGVTDFQSNTSDFATEHHWKLQVMEELDERFGKTLNSSQLQGYLASCAPQQSLDNLIPLALDKIKKYGKEPLDNEYYKQAKWLQNMLFTLFFVGRKDHPAFRELLHQEAISGIEALALLCAEKKHFVTPSEEEALHQKRQKIRRAFPKFVAISAVIVLGVIAQPYVSAYIENRAEVIEIVDDALVDISYARFDEAQSKILRASSRNILFTSSKINETKKLLTELEKKQRRSKVKNLILSAKKSISSMQFSRANNYLNKAREIGLLKNEVQQTHQLLQTNAESASGRYKFIKQGLVIEDTKTKLHWMRCSLGQVYSNNNCSGQTTRMKWSEARYTGENTTYAGYSDWRLPTKKELSTLIFCSSGEPALYEARCKGNYQKPTIYNYAFPRTSTDIYWTDITSVTDDGFALGVSFTFGYGGSYRKNLRNPARLVRSKE